MENENIVTNETQASATPEAKPAEKKVDNKPTYEELMTQLAQANADKAKYKNSIDKLTKNNGDLTKQLREHMTAEEQLAQAQKEADETHQAYVKELEDFKRMAEAKERYMSIQKMDSELASKAAMAEVSGDYMALANIQQQFNEQTIKAKEAEWLKSRPILNAGVGGEKTDITKEQFNAMGYKERVDFKNKYPSTYEAYIQ